jgi:hypothetical protein
MKENLDKKKNLKYERDNLCLLVGGAKQAKADHNQEGLKVVQIHLSFLSS